MKKIPADVSELKQAFHQHLAAHTSVTGSSSYLLLFYAAECGLKSIWLRRNNLQTTEDFPDQIEKHGHKLDMWCKELEIPASQFTFKTQTENKSTPSFHLACGGSSRNIGAAHQAWRYGITIKKEDEEYLVNWLHQLCNWIKENI
ncbi:hypothetical protein BJP34_06925 [Moorena producens PAL-8-15-08-1]|uniref:Uncharacterized protein n=1 Tax=Moorena producens PAL-8-15-08-1 TaxID=1458985 RepID=A0A1D8TNP0_9CYAN|nr:hypothetical protein [Moorena producens]AOW99224.1 hypothetical protein BJP34_06925 [Moorena producens PAL-8-15-08-1]